MLIQWQRIAASILASRSGMPSAYGSASLHLFVLSAIQLLYEIGGSAAIVQSGPHDLQADPAMSQQVTDV